MSDTQHVDYPHHPGTLYDCPPCEEIMSGGIGEDYGLIWVCVDCMMHHANGECGSCHAEEGHDREPWALLSDGFTVTMGMGWEEHDESCQRKCACTQDDDCEEHPADDPVTGDSRDSQHHDSSEHVCPDDYECDCETDTYSTSQCEGCGTYLHGSRHAFHLWKEHGTT